MLKWVEIDLAAIRANTRWVLSRLGQGARLMAVVKADGYGHGAAAVGRWQQLRRQRHQASPCRL